MYLYRVTSSSSSLTCPTFNRIQQPTSFFFLFLFFQSWKENGENVFTGFFSFISLQALIRYALAPPVYTCLSVCLCINTTAKIQQERDQPDAEEQSRAAQHSPESIDIFLLQRSTKDVRNRPLLIIM
jgi:hypothetical protein